MAKSMVERYEQVLAQDPASTVFVELAKALMEKGEHARAIEVCEAGLKHHPTSVVARVLWGKALIQAGRPAQAMSQFDAAIEIDRENPHAYNLIGEVLLHKGLYRSALPILKKAMALQPNEGRIKQWYEQAQQALAGGPAPVFADLTAVDAVAAPGGDGTSSPLGQEEVEKTDVQAPRIAAPDVEGERTAVHTLPTASDAFDDGEVPVGERTEIYRIPQGGPDGGVGLGEEPEQRTQVMGKASSEAHVSAEPSAVPPVQVRGDTDPFSSLGAEAPSSGEAERTIVTKALSPADDSGPLPFMAGPGALAAAGVTPAPIGSGTESGSRKDTPADGVEARRDTPAEGTGATDPFAKLSGTAEDDATLRGLTSTFDALEEKTAQSPDPFAAFAKEGEGDTVRGLTSTFDALSEGERESLPTLAEHQGPSVEVSPSAGDTGGLLGDLPDLPPEETSSTPGLAATPSSASDTSSSQRRGLLDDLPDFAAPSQVEMPKVELSPQATRAMADEYERELREKIKSAPQKKSFFARHAALSAFGAVLVLALGAFVGNFLYTRAKNRGQDLQDTLAAARKLIAADTRASLRESLTALELARSMDENSAEAWALTSYANALLVAEHGADASLKSAAEAALQRIGPSEDHVGFALVTRYLLAEGAAREAIAKELLNTPLAQTEVHETAGQILLARKASERALERFKQSLALSAGNVRTLVALGGYYQAAGDCTQALAVYTTAEAVSPKHPARTLGAAECRLEREEDLDAALEQVTAIEVGEKDDDALRARRELVLGQLLSHAKKHEEAIARLEKGMKIAPAREADFQLALGQAWARRGDMARAHKALEAAYKLAKGSERVKEALARVLIARDRSEDVLKRIDADDGERRLHLVRGIAAARLKQWKRARSELTKTAVDGKFPPEAIIQLTLADAAEGKPEYAQEALEKTLAATRRAKAEVRVALGQVYWQRGVLDKARTQFEESLADDEGYEGGCSLGRLLYTLGFPDLAIEPLKKSIARNGSHGEARDALGRAYIALGKIPEGLEQLEAWRKDNPDSADAYRGYAFGLYHAGEFEKADDAATQALKRDWREPKNHRIRAMIRFSRAQKKAAYSALERANKYEGDQKDGDTFCEIGHAFLREGDSRKATAAFEAAVRVDPTSPCGNIGQLAAKLPTSSRSVERELEAIAKKTPYAWDKAFANATLARVRISQGQLDDAAKAAEAALKQSPNSGRVHYALGLVLLRQKQEEKGIAALKKAAVLDGGNAEIRLAYADALSRAGELKDAVSEYQTVLALGAPADELRRIKKALPYLKKKLARR